MVCHEKMTRVIPKKQQKRLFDGMTIIAGGSTYRILSESAQTVVLTKAVNKRIVQVPETIQAESKSFRVIAVGTDAFKAKSIKTVILGTNIERIEEYTFRGSNAVRLTVKTKKLTKKNVKDSLKKSKIKTITVKTGC